MEFIGEEVHAPVDKEISMKQKVVVLRSAAREAGRVLFVL